VHVLQRQHGLVHLGVFRPDCLAIAAPGVFLALESVHNSSSPQFLVQVRPPFRSWQLVRHCERFVSRCCVEMQVCRLAPGRAVCLQSLFSLLPERSRNPAVCCGAACAFSAAICFAIFTGFLRTPDSPRRPCCLPIAWSISPPLSGMPSQQRQVFRRITLLPAAPASSVNTLASMSLLLIPLRTAS